MKFLYRINIFFTLFVLIASNIAIGKSPHGTTLARAKNVHSGNKVRTTFYNYGLVGRWGDEPDDIGGEWPINSTHEYIGDVGILVGSELNDNNGKLRHSVVTTYSPRGSEINPGTDIHWGWEPLMGYFNDDSNLVAMSHMGPPVDPSNPTHPDTWPDQWPDKMADELDPGWPNSWNGYFGKDQKNAEQESYFVMDDANDAEFEFFPDTTDFERKGMGLNAIVRGLQWNHIMAEDVLFWLYDVKNIGNRNHPKMVFGAVVGTITGGDGDSGDDYADFDKSDDIAYSYDHGTDLETGLGGIGAGGWSPVGLAGYAFLESPGNAIDGIDNDGDGASGSGAVISEAMFTPVSYAPGDSVVVIEYEHKYERKIVAMPSDQLEISYNGQKLIFYPNQPYEEIERNLIDDNLNGLIDENNGFAIETSPGFFEDVFLNVGLKYKDYFSGTGTDNLMIDESRSDGIDNDGDWDFETDDVGRDGAPGTGDTFYGEGDGLPTSGAGTEFPGEPNIDKTDIDESDQIGLSSFFYFSFGTFSDMGWDEGLWDKLFPGYFNKSIQNVDADFLFGSGYFPLQVGETERFSLALLFGDNLPDLVRNKQTVQTIYNQNYNFAKAPELPTVWAFAGDGYVTLYWDDRAENSFDRLSGYDFEGYKIYKATDTQFTDAGEITDAYGSHKFDIAIKQFDLDNEYSGFFELDIDGILFDLGKNTGLVHAYTDTSVLNGHRYFYAVTAYDHGLLEKSILPAETSKFVTIDKGGNVQTAPNVVAVIPEAPVAGYELPPPKEDVYPVHAPRGTGSITLKNIDPPRIPSGHVYRIFFKDSRSNGIDDDGDWVYLEDYYADGVWDSTETYYDYGIDGLPDTGDEGEENSQIDWYDYGIDGLKNNLEPDFNPFFNPDPNHDNYDPPDEEGEEYHNCSDGWDNDGDGEIDEVSTSGDCLDLGTEGDGIYQREEEGEPFLDGNVRFDNDVGHDGCRDEYENGFNGCFDEENPLYVEGDDPNHDNWNLDNNCTDGWDNDGDGDIDELNAIGRCADLGTEGNQEPDYGEPDVDHRDPEEMVPSTSHLMVVDVTNFNAPDTVVRWSESINNDNVIFNGMQIIINNDWGVNTKLSRFSPAYEEEYGTTIFPFVFAGFTTTGVGYPRDVQIIFSDTLIGQSQSVDLLKNTGEIITFESIPTNFVVRDPYDSSSISFAYIDQTREYEIPDSVFNPEDYDYFNIIGNTVDDSGNVSWLINFSDSGHFSYGDRIILLENLGDTTVVTWAISPSTHDNTVLLHTPGTGDTLNIEFTKPFTSEDVFEFVSNAPYVNTQKLKDDLPKVKVVPNPYIAGASWEGQNPYATGRGPRSLHFNHLPPNCEIRIYNLTGELVDILRHETDIDDGSAEWNMLTKENLDIAYGIYIYHIEPLPGSNYDFKPILGKFAVIK